MFAPDIPAWNSAFNELERKPLSPLEDMLVHSFDRYLRRKGYLTKEQVEVLQCIATKYDVPLPPIPPITRHTESNHTKQELNPRSALFQEIKNPLELKEAEVVKPEVIARWRTFVSEDMLRAIIRQREWLIEARRTEEWIRPPYFAYPTPRLKGIEEKPEVFAMAIDTDGWLTEAPAGRDKIGRIDRIIYRRMWEYAVVGFETLDFEVTLKVAKMMVSGITPLKPRPPRTPHISYTTRIYGSRAMRSIQLAEPYLLKNKQKAIKLLRKYREHPTRPYE